MAEVNKAHGTTFSAEQVWSNWKAHPLLGTKWQENYPEVSTKAEYMHTLFSINPTLGYTHTHTKFMYARERAKLLQSCPTVCNPMDCNPWTPLYVYIHGACQVCENTDTPEDRYKTAVSSTTNE